MSVLAERLDCEAALNRGAPLMDFKERLRESGEERADGRAAA